MSMQRSSVVTAVQKVWFELVFDIHTTETGYKRFQGGKKRKLDSVNESWINY
jgi:hypothetical protein